MEASTIFVLAERARAKLLQSTSRHDPDIRRVVGHVNLLDSITIQLCKFGFSNKNGGKEGELADSCSRLYTDDETDSSDDLDSDSNSSDDSDSNSSDDADSNCFDEADPESSDEEDDGVEVEY